MPRPRRTKQPNTLLTALKFIQCTQRAVGSVEQTHCRMFNRMVSASNGIISASHPTQEDIQCCPQTSTLVNALEECPGAVTLTLTDNRLLVQSEDFQVVVPCISLDSLPVIFADLATVLADNRLGASIGQAGAILSDTALRIVEAAFQLRRDTVLASNGGVILEAWHGQNLPGTLIVPKAMCTALKKATGKTIYRAGASASSFTVWHEDTSWIKTQTYPADTPMPDLYKWLDIPSTPVPMSEGLFAAVKRLAKFSKDGKIIISDSKAIVTTPDNGMMMDAQHNIKGIHKPMKFDITALLLVVSYANTIHWNVSPGVSLFFGEGVRGAIATESVADGEIPF